MNILKNNKILLIIFCFIILASLSLSILANDNPFDNVKVEQDAKPVDQGKIEQNNQFRIETSIASTIRIIGMLFIVIIICALPFV